MLTLCSGRPEDCGIPTEAIEAFEGLLQKQKVRIHGYLMMSGKRIFAEHYYAPYTKDSLHRMYSVTKSFVALAVGLLLKNGQLSLDDKICDYFPDKLPEGGVHPWCAEMTIRDILSMRTCHGSTTYKNYNGDDWTESFFHVRPDHVPGTVFSYDTSAAHVLGALVEKLTGMKLLDYMRKEMLDELGFSKEAYILEDPVGVSQGGSGLMSTLRDVAAVAYLCNHYGVLDGNELVPAEFMQETLKIQVPTDLQPKLDEQYGYGYFFWMPREEGFTLFGMGGQLAVCFPKYDFCYVTMTDEIGNPAGVQALHDCFYNTVYPYLEKYEITQRIEQIETVKLRGKPRRELTGIVSRDENLIRENTQDCTYSFYPNHRNWEKVTFDWNHGKINFQIPAGEFRFSFGQNTQQQFLNTGYRCECKGYWKLGHFILQCFVIDEELGNVQMDFAWKDSRLSVRIVSTDNLFIQDSELRKCFQGFASARRSP